jgi:hypothetical protein
MITTNSTKKNHPAGLDVVMVVYHLPYDLLVFFSVWVGGLVGGQGGVKQPACP